MIIVRQPVPLYSRILEKLRIKIYLNSLLLLRTRVFWNVITSCKFEIRVEKLIKSRKFYRIDGRALFAHEFNFHPFYQNGISDVVYIPRNDLLIVGGSIFGTVPNEPSSQDVGLSAWRILSDQPFYKQVTNYDDDMKSVCIQ